jgi:hypothetical protein
MSAKKNNTELLAHLQAVAKKLGEHFRVGSHSQRLQFYLVNNTTDVVIKKNATYDSIMRSFSILYEWSDVENKYILNKK